MFPNSLLRSAQLPRKYFFAASWHQNCRLTTPFQYPLDLCMVYLSTICLIFLWDQLVGTPVLRIVWRIHPLAEAKTHVFTRLVADRSQEAPGKSTWGKPRNGKQTSNGIDQGSQYSRNCGTSGHIFCGDFGGSVNPFYAALLARGWAPFHPLDSVRKAACT